MQLSLICARGPLLLGISDGVIVPFFEPQVPLHGVTEAQLLALSTTSHSLRDLANAVVDMLIAKLLSCLVDMRCLLFYRGRLQSVRDVESIIFIRLQVLANLCHCLVGIVFCCGDRCAAFLLICRGFFCTSLVNFSVIERRRDLSIWCYDSARLVQGNWAGANSNRESC